MNIKPISEESALLAVMSHVVYSGDAASGTRGSHIKERINHALAVNAIRFPKLARLIAGYEVDRPTNEILSMVNDEAKRVIISIRGCKSWDEAFDFMAQARPAITDAVLQKETIAQHELPMRFNRALIFTKAIRDQFPNH
jgi:hypothetical protein